MGILRQMGVLEGMTSLSTSRNLELLPTFTAISARTFDAATGTYQAVDQPEAAMNVSTDLTPNLTFDFTYNPDFSQIESDRPQITVNERFPVFYPELRPFFLEGQEIYQIAAPFPLAVVHTRALVDPCGAKLTGKVGNTSVGFLVANDEARASWTTAATLRSTRPRRPFSAACATTSIQSRTWASSSTANSSTATAG